jgi:hypothetical protein
VIISADWPQRAPTLRWPQLSPRQMQEGKQPKRAAAGFLTSSGPPAPDAFPHPPPNPTPPNPTPQQQPLWGAAMAPRASGVLLFRSGSRARRRRRVPRHRRPTAHAAVAFSRWCQWRVAWSLPPPRGLGAALLQSDRRPLAPGLTAGSWRRGRRCSRRAACPRPLLLDSVASGANRKGS